MKIVFVSAGAGGGGAEEVLFDLITALRELHPDWDLTVIFGEEGSLIQRLSDRNIKVERLLFPQSFQNLGEQEVKAPGLYRKLAGLLRLFGSVFSFAGYTWRLRKRILQLRPEIVHSNGIKMHLIAALATPSCRLVWHVHDYLSHRRISSLLLPRLSWKARILCNSADVVRDCKKLFRSDRVSLLENPIDTDRFQPNGERADLDKLSGMNPCEPGVLRFGLIATFANWKGHQLFLEAISLLPEGLPVRFYIIGGPIYSTQGSQWTMAELKEIAAKLAYKVGFTGWVKDASKAFRALDVCVHASTRPEPFGLVIAQAIACGKAVIVSGEGGAAEVVKGYNLATLFEPRNPKSLATAIEKLVGDSKLRDLSLKQGPEYAKTRFGKTLFIQRFNDYLQALIATP